MELSVLTAGINVGRKVAEQILIVRPSGEGGIENGGIDANQHRFESQIG